MPTIEFKFGDRVLHRGRPEWGTGVVTAVQNLASTGVPCQRVTLRFDRAGLKTLRTDAADLHPATDKAEPVAEQSQEPGNGGWLAGIEQRGRTPEQAFSTLPESCTDPFSPALERVRATLELYRFSKQGGPLLDWAASQSGLADPLSKFSRHELEQFFDRFAHERDAHIKRLVAEVREEDAPKLAAIVRSAPADARIAMQRVHARR